jgi:hypothetical protein
MLCRRILFSAAACAWLLLDLCACTPEAKELILEGDAKIATAADAENLARYTGITGRLTVKRAAIRELYLPRLKSIGGKLYVQKNADLTALRLPSLVSIGSDDGDVAIIERNPALVEIDLGGLRTAAYQIAVRSNDALARIDLGALAEIVGVGLEIADNPSLEQISVPGLIVAASISVTGCPRLHGVVVPDLKKTAAVVLERNDRLEILDMSGLERVAVDPGSDVTACRLSIVGNSALKGLQGLKSLAIVGPMCDVVVRDNAKLPQCDANGLYERLTKDGWRGTPSACGNEVDACGGEKCQDGEIRHDAGL